MSLDAIAALERERERFICDWCGMRPAIVGQVTIDDDLVTFILPCLECAMAAYAEWEQARSSTSGVSDNDEGNHRVQ